MKDGRGLLTFHAEPLVAQEPKLGLLDHPIKLTRSMAKRRQRDGVVD